MQRVSHPFQAMKDIFARPNRVFATISETHNWSWIPFIFIAFISALPIYMYFNFVDFSWYTELLVESVTQELSPAEQNAFRNMLPDQGQSLWTAIFASIFMLIISNAIMALYLYIVTKSDEECIKDYTDWYGFTWWVSIPAVSLSSAITLLILLLAQDDQISPVSLSPTSMAFIFSVDINSPWSSLMQAIRLESVWVMYLITVGLSQWTQLPVKKTYIIAIAPYLILWIIWALFIVI